MGIVAGVGQDRTCMEVLAATARASLHESVLRTLYHELSWALHEERLVAGTRTMYVSLTYGRGRIDISSYPAALSYCARTNPKIRTPIKYWGDRQGSHYFFDANCIYFLSPLEQVV